MAGIGKSLALAIGFSWASVTTSLVVGRSGFGQEVRPQPIGDEPICASCRITLAPVATLVAPRDSNSFDLTDAVYRGLDGTFLVGSQFTSAPIRVYSNSGVFLRNLGRVGQGPAEFQGPVIALPDGRDFNIRVFQQASGRFAVFSGDFMLLRSGKAERGISAAIQSANGNYVLAVARVADGRFHTLWELSSLNDSLRAIDGSPVPDSVPPGETFERVLARSSRSGHFWTAFASSVTLELWDAAGGRVIQRLVRRPRWFQTEPLTASRERPWSPSRVVGIREDERSLLWTLATVVDLNATPDSTPLQRGSRIDPRISRHGDAGELFDTMIEVLDPARGVLVTTLRHDALIRFTPDGTLAYAVRELPSGDRAIDIFQPSLSGYAPR